MGSGDGELVAELEARGRPPGHNAVLAALADVLGKVSTLAWTVVAARLLTHSQFGGFNLALSVALIASAVAEGGFDPVLVRRASTDPRRLAVYHTQAIAWQVGLAIPVFVLAAGSVWVARSETDLRVAVVLVLGATFLDLWSDTARASAAAARDQAATARALTLQRLAAAVLMIPALVAGLGLTGMAAGFLLSSAIGWVAHVRAIRPLGVAFRLRLVERSGMRSFAQGTFTLAVSSLVLMALLRIDTVILAWLAGDRVVGVYAAAYRLFDTVLFITYAVVGAVAPLMDARAGDRAEVARLAELMLVVLGVLYAPFVAVCLTEGRPMLQSLYGASYTDAVGAVRWLAAAPLCYAAAGVGTAVLIARRRNRPILVAAVAALAVNVALNLVLIPSLAGTGAALATTASYAVQAAIGLVFVAREIPGLRIFSPLAEAAVAATLLGAGLELVAAPVWPAIVLGGLSYLGVWSALVRVRRPAQLAAMRTLLTRSSVPEAPPDAGVVGHIP